MVQLPTEQAIGDLPDHLPRRQGVGGWQPGDLARGGEQIARGGESLGVDLGMLGGALQRQSDQADTANANSFLAVQNVRTGQALATETDPVKAAVIKDHYDDNYQDAAAMIQNPDARAKAQLTWAPEQARMQVGVDDHVKGLVNNSAIADFDSYRPQAINAALSTDDPIQRTNIWNAIGARGQTLVSSGALNPQQLQQRGAQDAHDYGEGLVKAAQDYAKRTGDTSKLEQMRSLFQFGPDTGWGQPAGGAAPAAGQIANTNLPPEAQALLKTIYGPESGGAYNKRYTPGGDANFSGFADHPRVSEPITSGPDAGSTSDAAGAPQFLSKTWDAEKAKLGLKDFSPANQDTAAWDLASTTYKEKTNGGDLLTALQSKDPKTLTGVADALKGQWSSLPGGHQPGTTADKFVSSFASNLQSVGQPPAAGPVAQRPNATNSYFIGDSVADGLRRAAGAPGDTAQDRNPDHVQDAIDDTDPKDLQGKTIYLSSGASNDSKSAAALASQLDSLKIKGVDMRNVRVIGVGDRPDFTANGVNATLAGIASKAGATFTGPLDTTNLRRNANVPSDNGVHLDDWGKGLDQVAGTNAMAQPAGAAAGPSPFLGHPPGSGPNPDFVPPKAQWPDGAQSVKQNTDGSMSYVMSDGSERPIPGMRATGAGGYPSPTKTGTPFDAMKPVEKAELGLQIENTINEVNRQKQAATKYYVKQASDDMGATLQNAISGNGVGPNERTLMQQKYANSQFPEIRQRYATSEYVLQNLDAFKGMTTAQVEARVENMRVRYNQDREADPENPALPANAEALDAAQKYSKAYAEQAAKTPLEAAATRGILPNGVTPLPTDPSDPNFAPAMAKRVTDAHAASEAFGTPIKYFQQTDRPTMKRIAQAGGQPMIDLARNIVEGAGADSGAVFKEIGVDSPAMQWMGTHAASGGDPEAANDRASVLQAKSEKKDLPLFGKGFAGNFYDAGDSPLGGAVAGFSPKYAGMINDAASDLMTAQAVRDGKPLQVKDSDYDKDFVEKAYNLALGATIQPDGTRYGGIAPRSVKPGFWSSKVDDRVVIPNNIKASDFDAVIHSIGPDDIEAMPNQPVAKNQTPITARQIQDGLLEAYPDKDGIFRGKYGVFTDGVHDDDHMVRNHDGTRWLLDLAQPSLDTSLRKSHPESFLGGAQGAKIPTPQTPTRRGYEQTPGAVALSSGAEGE